MTYNDNVDMKDPEEKFKFVNNLTLLEKVNPLMKGLSSFNIKSSVPSDIPVHNGVIPTEHLKHQNIYIKYMSDLKKTKVN